MAFKLSFIGDVKIKGVDRMKDIESRLHKDLAGTLGPLPEGAETPLYTLAEIRQRAQVMREGLPGQGSECAGGSSHRRNHHERRAGHGHSSLSAC